MLDVGFGHALGAVAEFLHHQFGGVGVQRLGDGGHHAELHQRLDHVGRAGGHAVGQLLHGDRVRQDDVAHDFHLIGAQPLQFGLTAFALALAADRGEGADRSSSPSMAACTSMRPARRRSSTAFLGAATGGLRGGRHGAAGAADRPRLVVVLAARVGRRRSVSVGAPGGGGRGGRGRTAPRLLGAARHARPRPGAPARRRRPRRPCARLPRRSARCFLGRAAASSSAALRASSSRRRASSAAERIEIFSCSRRSASRRAVSRCCSASARWRAASSVAVSARRRGRRRPARRRCGARGGAAGRRPPAAGQPGARRADRARFLRTSTCTTLERPWLKLCRTDPASTVRPTSSRPAGRSESRPLSVS